MSQRCSCTECVYSPNPNKHKSKIGKLYQSKHLSRQKRKLLKKLVETRAAYDELRDQILSGSTDDVDSENVSYKSEDFDKKSVEKFVDLVDRGQFPLLRSSVNLHNECCECCYCSSNIKIKKRREIHNALPTDTQLRRSLEFRKQKTGRDRNAVRFHAVRSEPCICSLKFSNLKNIPKRIHQISSREIFKRKSKKYKKPVECECIPDDDELSFTTESRSKFKKTLNKIRESLRSFQSHISSNEIFKKKTKEYKGLVECECILDEDELSLAIESPSKFKKRLNNVRESLRSIETSSKELYRKLSLKRKKHEVGDFESFDEYYKKPSLTERSKTKIKQTRDKFREGIRSSMSKLENTFQIKKDSIMLFREKLRRKKAIKAWTCDPDFCNPNIECIPEECHEKIKIREAKKNKKQQVQSFKPEGGTFQNQVSVITFRIDPKSQKDGLRPETKRKARKDKVICECKTKTRSESSMTRHRRRRTHKSMSDSVITASNKTTDTLFKQVPNKINDSQYSMNETDRMTNLPKTVSKQAVKISSSCKFEIEFYKDKNPIQKVSNRTEREYDSQNHYRSTRKKNARAQQSIPVHKRSTQTIDISSAEKLPFPRECDPCMCVPGKCNPRKCAAILLKQSQGNHKLERCFCTLQLQKTPKRHDKKSNITRPIKLEQISDSISVQTTKKSIPNTDHTQNLMPYECEPYVCIPGKCDPVVCYERIKKHNAIKNKSINTLTQRTKRRGVKSSSVTNSNPVGTKIRGQNQGKRFSRQKSGLHTVPVEKSRSSFTTSNRQIVKISSSFKFDIEFYKKTDENNSVTEHQNANDNKEKKFDSSPPPKRDSYSNKSDVKSILKRCFCTQQFRKKTKVKIKQVKRRSKIIMTDTKRKKSRRHQTKVVECKCKNESDKSFAKTKASMTSTVVNYVVPPAHHQNRNILSNECEPLFCIPGKCDPHICLQRIKSRNIKRIERQSKEKGTMSEKSISTLTSIGNIYSSRKVQAVHTARRKKRDYDGGVYDRRMNDLDKTEAYVSKSSPSPPRAARRKKRDHDGGVYDRRMNDLDQKEAYVSKSSPSPPRAVRRKRRDHDGGVNDERMRDFNFDKKEAYISKSSPSPPRPGVRIGSSFRFDIEFYKTNKLSESTILEKHGQNKMHHNSELSNINKQKNKTKGTGDYAEERSEISRTKDSVKSKLFLTPPLQRCYCTLKLNKKPKQNIKKTVPKATKVSSRRMIICDCKVASTQTPKQTMKSKLREDISYNVSTRYELLPYECEPNFCIPGQCDPFVCYKRVKSRNLLKNCLCTLKLHKLSKNQRSATNLKNVKGTASTGIVKEKHRGHNLLLYECSPGFCDPGNCNPYKCHELLKKRNTINISPQNQFASTHKPVRKWSFIETSRRSKISQSTLIPKQSNAKRKDKHGKKRKNNFRRQNATNNTSTRSSNSSFSSRSKPRQAVRIGSSCSFNIEFSKNKLSNVKHKRYRISRNNFVSDSDIKLSQVSRARVDKSSKNIESKLERCFCTLKLQKRGKRNKENRFNNNMEVSMGMDYRKPGKRGVLKNRFNSNMEVSREMDHRKSGKRGALEITREKNYKRQRRQRPQGGNMIDITTQKHHQRQKDPQKPRVEQPKETVQQQQETVLITREVKEVKPEPPPVQYQYVYRTVKYTGDNKAPIVNEINASQVDINKLTAAGVAAPALP